MKERSPKGKMLADIRNALITTTSKPFPQIDTQENYYKSNDEPLEIQFAQEFTKSMGNFIFCENSEEFLKNINFLTEDKKWQHLFCWDKELQKLLQDSGFKKCRIGKDLSKADAGITSCEALIARTGSVLLSSGLPSGRSLSIYPPVHIVVAYTYQLVADIYQGLAVIKEKYPNRLPSMINIASGPSRTADIEKTLVLGAHGPKEVYLFLIDQQE